MEQDTLGNQGDCSIGLGPGVGGGGSGGVALRLSCLVFRLRCYVLRVSVSMISNKKTEQFE